MDKALLLNKLIHCEDINFELYRYYVDATSESFENEVDEFNKCINDIKILSSKQYDFEWLSTNAKWFGVNRREFKSLCDDVCVLLGNRITELCKHTRDYIITKPTNFEDYCPFSNELTVVYGPDLSNISKYMYINVDGKKHKVIDTKLESTPYYTIYCNQLDL